MYSYTDPDLCLRSAVYDGVYHTPLGRFSMVDISTIGVVSVPKRGRRWKRLAESFPKTCGLVSAPSWLSSNRAWNTASGWYDIPGTPSYKVVGWPNWGVLDGPAATRSCNVSNSDDSSVFFLRRSLRGCCQVGGSDRKILLPFNTVLTRYLQLLPV